MSDVADPAALLARLGADDRSARRTAAVRLAGTLAAIEDADAYAPLVGRALADVDVQVRGAVVQALVELAGAGRHLEMIERVVSARLDEQDVVLRRGLVAALTTVLVVSGRAPAPSGPLARSLADPDADVRLLLVSALWELADDEVAIDAWIDALVLRLDDPHAHVRDAAMRALTVAARRDPAMAGRVHREYAALRRRASGG